MKNNNPVISICIPTYNRDNILRENMERLLVLPHLMTMLVVGGI